SRTPEGIPNRCPVCGSAVRIEPSSPSGDAPCPTCGHLLWFTRSAVRPSKRSSGSKIGWVLVILAVAVLGVLLFGPVYNLSFAEYMVLLLIAVPLCGRRPPEFGRWLGNALVRMR